jgi:hypothetical protein
MRGHSNEARCCLWFCRALSHRLRLKLPPATAPGNSLLSQVLNPVCCAPAAEIVRVVDALQLSARASVATPANWPNNHENIGAKVSFEALTTKLLAKTLISGTIRAKVSTDS